VDQGIETQLTSSILCFSLIASIIIFSIPTCPISTVMPIPTHFTLNTSAKIPAVGFGMWQAKPGEVERAVETAIKAGYRHIDCAAIYPKVEVGDGIRQSGVPRSDIFTTGKL
jgi:hypothetical protein